MLIVLRGTVPISFKGARYNIPVTIEMPENYPYQPPLCKVAPTPTMVLVPNQRYVDASGVIFGEVISRWHPSQSLLSVYTEIQRIFTEQPPVRSKAVQSAPPPSYTQTTQQNPSPAYSTDMSPNLGGQVNQPQHQLQPNPATGAPATSPSQIAETNLRRAVAAKVHSYMGERTESLSKQLKATTTENDRLNEKNRQLDDDLKYYKALLAEHQSTVEKLSREKDAAESKLIELRGQIAAAEQEKDVLKLFSPDVPLVAQNFELQARSLAIDDAQYGLEQALQQGLSLQVFMKETRKLAAEQFRCRALQAQVAQQLSRYEQLSRQQHQLMTRHATEVHPAHIPQQ